MIAYVNLVALCVICGWSTWCVLSPFVKDGIIGKLIFSTLSISSLAVLLGGDNLAYALLNSSIAAVGVRHVFMRHAWKHVVKYFRCAVCPERKLK